MGKKRQRDGNLTATVTKRKKLDCPSRPTQGSSLCSPKPAAIVTQKSTESAANPDVTPVKENTIVGKPKVAKGDAERRNDKSSAIITQESEKPTRLKSGHESEPTEVPTTIAEEAVTQEKDSSLQVNAKKHPRRKNFCLEPVGKSWLPHIAGLVVNKMISRAANLGIDPFTQPERVQFTLSEEDIKIMCQYISKQYPGMSMQSVLSELEPYTKLMEKNIVKHDVEVKYKDVIPKPPMSSYLLFYQRKLGVLKTKYPKMKATELSQKVGLKWKKLQPEKKELYTKEYNRLKEEYRVKLEQFYAEHPDARPISAPKSSNLQELKKLMPKKCPTSACTLFCQERRKTMQTKRPDLKPKEITICLRSKWVKLSKEEKAPFIQQFEEMKKEYKTKMEQFIKDHPDMEELFEKSKEKAELSQANDEATHSQSLLPIQTKDDDDETEKCENDVTSDEDENEDEDLSHN